MQSPPRRAVAPSPLAKQRRRQRQKQHPVSRTSPVVCNPCLARVPLRCETPCTARHVEQGALTEGPGMRMMSIPNAMGSMSAATAALAVLSAPCCVMLSSRSATTSGGMLAGWWIMTCEARAARSPEFGRRAALQPQGGSGCLALAQGQPVCSDCGTRGPATTSARQCHGATTATATALPAGPVGGGCAA